MPTKVIASPAIDPRFTCFRMEIRESKIHRRGVYALERIPARHKVIEYTGELISRRETKRRGQGNITYLFTLDNYWTIDGAVGGSYECVVLSHPRTPVSCGRDGGSERFWRRRRPRQKPDGHRLRAARLDPGP